MIASTASLRAAHHGDETRFHALDAVRAGAVLSGIVLHATLSFFPQDQVAIAPVVDSTSSHSLGLTFYVIHSFRMVLFFMLAGFFSRLIIERKGMRYFLAGRAKRVLLPFTVAMILMALVGRALPLLVPSGSIALERLQPLWHLWFLYLLCWFYALIAVAIAARDYAPPALRQQLEAGGDRLVGSPWLPLLAAIPGAIALTSLPVWAAWFGIPTPGWWPNHATLVCYGSAMVVGWLMHRRIESLKALEHRWLIYLGVAVFATSACVLVVGVRPSVRLASRSVGTAVYALLYSVAGWSWALAMVGLGLRIFAAPNKVIRYISEGAYWVYLVHLPLIFFLQATIARWNLAWPLKYFIVVGVSVPLLFGSYSFFGRRRGWV